LDSDKIPDLGILPSDRLHQVSPKFHKHYDTDRKRQKKNVQVSGRVSRHKGIQNGSRIRQCHTVIDNEHQRNTANEKKKEHKRIVTENKARKGRKSLSPFKSHVKRKHMPDDSGTACDKAGIKQRRYEIFCNLHGNDRLHNIKEHYKNASNAYDLFNDDPEALPLMQSIVDRVTEKIRLASPRRIVMTGGPSEGEAWRKLLLKKLPALEFSSMQSFAGAVGGAMIAMGAVK
jgi:hypothetical protein